MYDLNQYLTKTTSEVGACPCCVPLTAPALIPAFMPNVDPPGNILTELWLLSFARGKRSFPASLGASHAPGSGKNPGLSPFIQHLLVKGVSYWLQSSHGHHSSLPRQEGHPFPSGILSSTLHMDQLVPAELQTLLSLLLQLADTRHCPAEKIPCRERVRGGISAPGAPAQPCWGIFKKSPMCIPITPSWRSRSM